MGKEEDNEQEEQNKSYTWQWNMCKYNNLGKIQDSMTTFILLFLEMDIRFMSRVETCSLAKFYLSRISNHFVN